MAKLATTLTVFVFEQTADNKEKFIYDLKVEDEDQKARLKTILEEIWSKSKDKESGSFPTASKIG